MSDGNILLNSGRLFPFQFQLLAVIFILIGIVLVPNQAIGGFSLIVFGGLIITGRTGTEFDFSKGNYRHFNSFFWIKFGKWMQLKRPEKIYINAIKTSQKIYSRANQSMEKKDQLFKGYLKFADGEKIFLMERKDKTKMLNNLSPLATYFDLEITVNK